MENDLTWVPEKDMGQAPVPVVTGTVWVAAVPWDDDRSPGLGNGPDPEAPRGAEDFIIPRGLGPVAAWGFEVETTLVGLVTHC